MACIQHKVQHPESLLSSAVPTGPWDIVGADLGTFNGTTYLVVLGAYSSYPEVVTQINTSSSSVVKHLKSVFARHGRPNLLKTDNGLQFVSEEFRTFTTKWKISHVTSKACCILRAMGCPRPERKSLNRSLRKVRRTLLRDSWRLGPHPMTPDTARHSCRFHARFERCFVRRRNCTHPASPIWIRVARSSDNAKNGRQEPTTHATEQRSYPKTRSVRASG